MSFRNRCQIVGAEGMIDLSIPLVGGRAQKGLIRDVRIAGKDAWQQQHWRTICSCYNRSPWFDYYRDGLEALYRKPADFLLDWNLGCFEWSLRALGMKREIGLSADYRTGYEPGEVADWRGKIVPKDRKNWEGDAVGTGSGWPAAPRYRQVFEDRIGFTSNLSILDLLFCEGREAIRYIRSSDDGKPSGAGARVFEG